MDKNLSCSPSFKNPGVACEAFSCSRQCIKVEDGEQGTIHSKFLLFVFSFPRILVTKVKLQKAEETYA
jgi:hypothetical protein